MLKRIFPIIASVLLIAIFALLFNFSLPNFENFVVKKRISSISESYLDRFFKSLSPDEVLNLQQLPCAAGSTSCPDITSITKKFLDGFKSEKISKTLILTKDGIEVFSGKKLDSKYDSLILLADKNGMAEFSNSSDVSDKRVIMIYKISQLNSQIALDNKFILLVSGKDKLGLSTYKIIFGLLLFIPMVIILIYLMLNEKNVVKIKDRLEIENQNYITEVEYLKKQNIQQSQFLANFTHELRTPLNSIIGFSGLLKDQTLGSLGNSEYIKYATDINASGVHLLSLINDILDYSKSEVGKLKVNITETDIIKVIKQSLSIIAPRASESKVDLLQSFANDYFIIRLDPKRFKQIMLNLLSNSVKFTPESGSVMISVFPDLKGEKVSIEVKDTGVGIAEKDIPTVMSLFGQVETELNRKYEGTGIGLPFAKKLTALMGGSFDLQSKVGIGTRITLTFPFDKKLNAEYALLYKKNTIQT